MPLDTRTGIENNSKNILNNLLQSSFFSGDSVHVCGGAGHTLALDYHFEKAILMRPCHHLYCHSYATCLCPMVSCLNAIHEKKVGQ